MDKRALQLFSYEGITIRTVVIEDDIWFIAADVCAFLELKNVSRAVSRIKDNHRTTITIGDSGSNYKHQSLCVNEPGLYKLIFASRKPEAEAFQDWIYEEVLPSIRKNGSYSAPQQQPVPTISDALRERALLNEVRVPDGFFAVLIEVERELYLWEKRLNQTLDNKAEVEKSVGRHWSDYARNTLRIPNSERNTYPHTLAHKSGPVHPCAYPIKYLPAFRRWLREIYFPLKFDAYAKGRTRRIGAPVTQISAPRKLTAIGDKKQLQLF